MFIQGATFIPDSRVPLKSCKIIEIVFNNENKILDSFDPNY